MDVRFSELCTFTGRQWQATDIADSHKYILYGGSRGPGKSHWLRWYPVRFLLLQAARGLKRVRVGLFCEDYPALKDRHITKIESDFPRWLGELKDSKADGMGFHLRPEYGGGIIALRNLDDPSKYKSAEYALIAVDELTQNRSIRIFDTLRGSLRWPGLDDTKFIAASNPDGPGQEWVRALWIERNFPEEMRSLADKFVFVPGLPGDNPYLSQSYWDELNSMPEPLRSAWRDGNWYVSFANAVYSDFNQDNITSEEAPDPDLPIEIAFDDGYIDARAILFIQRTGNRVFVFDELYHRKHLESECVDELVDRCGEWFGWLDKDARQPNKLPEIAVGSPEAKTLHVYLRKANIPVRTKGIPSVVEAIKPVRTLIRDGNGRRSLSVHSRCTNFISELTNGYRYPEGARVGSNEKPLDENNHACDAFRDWAWLRAR